MTINGNLPSSKHRRQRTLLELITVLPVGSQEELVELLRERGFEVTQATVSRDAAELGLVKAPRGDRHVYATPESAATGDAYDARLGRLLEDLAHTGSDGSVDAGAVAIVQGVFDLLKGHARGAELDCLRLPLSRQDSACAGLRFGHRCLQFFTGRQGGGRRQQKGQLYG